MSEFAAFVGIDWSDKKHDLCLVDASTGRKEFSIIKHCRESLDEWALKLRTRFAGQKVAVCLEQSRGPLIFALLKYDFLALYPVHPKTLSRCREAFSPSRAKDDPKDNLEVLAGPYALRRGNLPGRPAQAGLTAVAEAVGRVSYSDQSRAVS
jgi:hypothetical protein